MRMQTNPEKQLTGKRKVMLMMLMFIENYGKDKLDEVPVDVHR